MKTLSIVTTLYNSANYMRKCIDSLLAQDISKESYEIILVNDGSPDNSKSIAEEYAEKYSNIIVLSQENKGLSGARNTGLNFASGKYVCFVDPDDYVEINSTAAILEKMENENLDVLRFDYTCVDEDYNVWLPKSGGEKIDYSSEILDGELFLAKRLGSCCFVWTYFYRTALLKDNDLYYTQGVYFDDVDWLPSVLRVAKRVNSIAIKRHYYLIRQGSLVNANDYKSTVKKINGQLQIIGILNKNKSSCSNREVVKWYDNMISKTSLGLLMSATSTPFKERNTYIKQLKSYNVFPLQKTSNSRRLELFRRMANISAPLFCVVLGLWYKIRAGKK